MTIAGDKVRVTVSVRAQPEVAFRVFTEEIDLWWRRGPAYRVAGRQPGVLTLEPGVGGRLFEQYEGAQGPAVHQAGTITVWEPPARLAFQWRGVNFAPGESTEVEVCFNARPGGGTEVVLEHRGFAALRPDHPVRHGEPSVIFIRRLGLWWSQLLSSLRDRAQAAP